MFIHFTVQYIKAGSDFNHEFHVIMCRLYVPKSAKKCLLCFAQRQIFMELVSGKLLFTRSLLNVKTNTSLPPNDCSMFLCKV